MGYSYQSKKGMDYDNSKVEKSILENGGKIEYLQFLKEIANSEDQMTLKELYDLSSELDIPSLSRYIVKFMMKYASLAMANSMSGVLQHYSQQFMNKELPTETEVMEYRNKLRTILRMSIDFELCDMKGTRTKSNLEPLSWNDLI